MVGRRILGVLAGNDLPQEIVGRWAGSAEVVIAADGAANALLAQGIRPDFVVGDMDSIQLDQLDLHDPLVLVEAGDQETTDCDKLLDFAFGNGADAMTIVGIEGDRFDHVFAAAHSLSRSRLPVRLVLRTGFGFVVQAGYSQQIKTQAGQTVSFLPIVECRGVEMTGVKWEPKSTLSPLGATSISNEAVGEEVSIRLAEGVGLLIALQDSGDPVW